MKRKKKMPKRYADMVELDSKPDGSRQFIITLHGDTFKNPLPRHFELEFVSRKKRLP